MAHHAPPAEHVARVLSRVQAKPNGRGWMARCPAHDDRTPSLSIAQGDDGRVLLKCHAGCTHNGPKVAVSTFSPSSLTTQEQVYRMLPTISPSTSATKASSGRKSAWPRITWTR